MLGCTQPLHPSRRAFVFPFLAVNKNLTEENMKNLKQPLVIVKCMFISHLWARDINYHWPSLYSHHSRILSCNYYKSLDKNMAWSTWYHTLIKTTNNLYIPFFGKECEHFLSFKPQPFFLYCNRPMFLIVLNIYCKPNC